MAAPPTSWPIIDTKWLTADTYEDPPGVLGAPDLLTGSMPCSFTAEQWAKLAEIKALLVSVAAVLDAVAVPYFLFGGTLLGAYRHGGAWRGGEGTCDRQLLSPLLAPLPLHRRQDVIPWDDDADICVPIESHDAMFSAGSQARAAARGFVFRHGHLPASSDHYYDPIAKYLATQRRLGAARAGAGAAAAAGAGLRRELDAKEETAGFFSRARCLAPGGGLGECYVDIFHLVPVELDGVAKLSDTCATWVYDREDFFPLRRCVLGGVEFSCPARTRKHLIYTYHDLGLPGMWDGEQQADIDRLATKFRHITAVSHPWRQQIVEDERGEQHFYLPAAGTEEALLAEMRAKLAAAEESGSAAKTSRSDGAAEGQT